MKGFIACKLVLDKVLCVYLKGNTIKSLPQYYWDS